MKQPRSGFLLSVSASLLCTILASTAHANGRVLGPLGPKTPGYGIGTGVNPSGLPGFGSSSGGNPTRMPDFEGEGSGLPKIGGGKGTGGPRPFTPTWEEQGSEGSGIITRGPGVKNIHPDRKDFGTMLGDLTNGSPESQAENALIAGDFYSASRSCLKAAQGTSADLNFSDQQIDAYRDPSYAAIRAAKEAFLELPLPIQAKFKKQQNNIMTPQAPCLDTTEKQMCRQLLGRALTDEQQSHYKPSQPNKPLDPKVQAAKERAAKNLEIMKKESDKKTENKISLTPEQDTDPALLLFMAIDQALAEGDKIGAQGALELLKDINPSAAHALECLGVMTFKIDENEEFKVNVGKDKAKIGPISGFDYTDDLKETGQIGPIVSTVGRKIGYESLKAVAVKLAEDILGATEEQIDKWFTSQAEREAKVRQEDQDWQACKARGSHACDQFYPNAVIVDDRAKNGLDIYTGKPLKNPDDKGTAGPSRPIDTDPLAVAKEGIKGPSIGPTPKRPVESSFTDEEKGMFGVQKLTQKERQELAKTRDPVATENYCASVVQEFSHVLQKDLTMTNFDDELSFEEKAFKAKMGSGGSPMPFDQWNNDFWNDVKDRESRDPIKVAKKNSCNSMDPVTPN